MQGRILGYRRPLVKDWLFWAAIAAGFLRAAVTVARSGDQVDWIDLPVTIVGGGFLSVWFFRDWPDGQLIGFHQPIVRDPLLWAAIALGATAYVLMHVARGGWTYFSVSPIVVAVVGVIGGNIRNGWRRGASGRDIAEHQLEATDTER